MQTLAARFATAPEHIIGGRTLNALPSNPYSSTSQLIIDFIYAYYNPDPNQARFFTSNNLALSADRFRAMGGFNESFSRAEDRELCDRWLYCGYQMTYAPEVTLLHAHALTLRRFWQQHFNYGRGTFRFHQVRAQGGWGSFRPELKFYWNLLYYPFLKTIGWRSLLLWALLGIAQAANAAGFFWEKMKRTD